MAMKVQYNAQGQPYLIGSSGVTVGPAPVPNPSLLAKYQPAARASLSFTYGPPPPPPDAGSGVPANWLDNLTATEKAIGGLAVLALLLALGGRRR